MSRECKACGGTGLFGHTLSHPTPDDLCRSWPCETCLGTGRQVTRDIYAEAVAQKPHEPASKFQHSDFVTEITARILETLAGEITGRDALRLYNAYDHVMSFGEASE